MKWSCFFGRFRSNSLAKSSRHGFVSRPVFVENGASRAPAPAPAPALSAVTARVSISVLVTEVQASERKHLSAVDFGVNGVTTNNPSGACLAAPRAGVGRG